MHCDPLGLRKGLGLGSGRATVRVRVRAEVRVRVKGYVYRYHLLTLSPDGKMIGRGKKIIMTITIIRQRKLQEKRREE
jgi:hypothetical protein